MFLFTSILSSDTLMLLPASRPLVKQATEEDINNEYRTRLYLRNYLRFNKTISCKNVKS